MNFCYVLENEQRTYVGYTVNPIRRLKQHNGILCGGAKYTTSYLGYGVWKYLAVVYSEQFTRNTGLSFEWHIKHDKNRIPGKYGRLIAILRAARLEKFKDHHFTLFTDLEINDEIPDNVSVSFLEDYKSLIVGIGSNTKVENMNSSSSSALSS